MRAHKYADLIPPMKPEEFAALKADIKENGQLEPVTTYEGKILDGRHRYKACRELKIEPNLWEYDGDDPVAFVWAMNGARRHLSPSQLAAVSAEIADTLKKPERGGGDRKSVAAKSKSQGCDNGVGRSSEQAAKMVGTSARATQAAQQVKRNNPEAFEKVKRGELTVAQAARTVKRESKRKELNQKADEAKKELKKEPDASWRIINGDCVEELPKLGKVKLIFTDPPYNIGIDYGPGSKADLLPAGQYLSWCQKWINLCANCLTRDGSFWLMINDEWVEHFAIMMNDAGLHRRAWIKWYETFGNNCANNFNRCSRHILYYVVDQKKFVFNRTDYNTRKSDRQTKYNDSRADPDGKFVDDVWSDIPRLVENDKERMPDFPTQIPLKLTRRIVATAANPGDLVVDPFNGSGSTGVAAKELGMRYVGIEKEELSWERATVRLATTTPFAANARSKGMREK